MWPRWLKLSLWMGQVLSILLHELEVEHYLLKKTENVITSTTYKVKRFIFCLRIVDHQVIPVCHSNQLCIQNSWVIAHKLSRITALITQKGYWHYAQVPCIMPKQHCPHYPPLPGSHCARPKHANVLISATQNGYCGKSSWTMPRPTSSERPGNDTQNVAYAQNWVTTLKLYFEGQACLGMVYSILHNESKL